MEEFKPGMLGRRFMDAMAEAGITLPEHLKSVTIQADLDEMVIVSFHCLADVHKLANAIRLARGSDLTGAVSDKIRETCR